MSTSPQIIRVAINGFGRIGRYTAKLLLANPDLNLVAINDLADKTAIAHLLKYDSVHGRYDSEISLSSDKLIVNDHEITLLSKSDPKDLPWKALNIDLVIECTGRFTHTEGASMHLLAGAKKVIISAPSQEESIPMIVMGVNGALMQSVGVADGVAAVLAGVTVIVPVAFTEPHPPVRGMI